ncbi:protein of unknown function [Paraburkholderia kururiensis]
MRHDRDSRKANATRSVRIFDTLVPSGQARRHEAALARAIVFPLIKNILESAVNPGKSLIGR